MTIEDVRYIIHKELEENPETTSLAISKKYRISFIIVEMFKRRIERKLK